MRLNLYQQKKQRGCSFQASALELAGIMLWMWFIAQEMQRIILQKTSVLNTGKGKLTILLSLMRMETFLKLLDKPLSDESISYRRRGLYWLVGC